MPLAVITATIPLHESQQAGLTRENIMRKTIANAVSILLLATASAMTAADGPHTDTAAFEIYAGTVSGRSDFNYTVELVQVETRPTLFISAWINTSLVKSAAHISVPVTVQQPAELTTLTELLRSPAFQNNETYNESRRVWVYEKQQDEDCSPVTVAWQTKDYAYPQVSSGANALLRDLVARIFTLEEDGTIRVSEANIPTSFTLSRSTHIPAFTLNCQPVWRLSAPSTHQVSRRTGSMEDLVKMLEPVPSLAIVQHYPHVPPSLWCRFGTAAVTVAAAAWGVLASGLVFSSAG